MKEHVNFYENLKEAHMRLRQTVVVYQQVPYHVIAICNHKPDGIFRVYLAPLYRLPTEVYDWPGVDDFGCEDPALGAYLDKWLDSREGKTRIIRKRMDSSHFNKFRPFPIGMCNYGAKTYYIERQPQRHREQGLTRAMIMERLITAGAQPIQMRGGTYVDIFSQAFASCVIGDHPTAKECLANLLDPKIENESVAFHRDFALVRGPIGMVFLAYKADVIGVLPNGDFGTVKIGREFLHTREVVSELRLFGNVTQ